MNNECGNTHTSAAGNTFKCTVQRYHTSSHRAVNARTGRVWKEWPLTFAKHPSVYAKGVFVGGRGYGKTAYQQWFLDDWATIKADLVKAAEDLEAACKPKETPVLLTLEDLKTISYYLPFYTDDDDDQDNITKAKIDAALKGML